MKLLNSMEVVLAALLYASYATSAAAYAPTPQRPLAGNAGISTVTTATQLYSTPTVETKRPVHRQQRRYNQRYYYNNNGSSSSSSPSSGDSAEVSKLKSQLHYIKGQIVEANLRATAAERRVAILSREKDNDGSEVSQTGSTVVVENALEKVKMEMKAEEERLRTQAKTLENEVQKLQQKMEAQTDELHQTKHKLSSSESQNADLLIQNREIQERSNQIVSDLEQRHEQEQTLLNDEKLSLEKELDALHVSYARKLAQFKTDKQELKASHQQELTALQTKMDQQIMKLTQDYENKKAAMIRDYEQKLEERDISIAMYRAERQSMRKLGKLVWSLMKERVVNAVRRKRVGTKQKNNGSEGTMETSRHGT